MNRRPNRPFFSSHGALRRWASWMRPLHVSSNWMCSLGNAMEMACRDSKRFQAFPTQWLSDCWFLLKISIEMGGWSRESISRMTFRVEGVREIRWDTAYICVFFGWWSELHQGGCQMSGQVWLKVLRSARKHHQLGGLMPNFWGHIAFILHHTGITTMKRRNQLHLINSRPACSSPESPKKTRKKGGNGWWFPYVSLIGWLVHVFKSLLNGRSQDRLRFRHHRLRERYPVQMGGVSRKMGEWE